MSASATGPGHPGPPRHGATVALAAVALVVGWPSTVLQPQVGIDPSWIMGLHLAGDAGLHLGQDVVFTFGPLGPLTRPVDLDAGALVPGLLVRLAAMAAVAGLTAHACRRVLSTIPAVLATLLFVPVLLVPFGRGADPELLLVLYVAGLLHLVAVPRRPWHHVAATGAAVLLLYAKVSAGLTAFALWGVFEVAEVLRRPGDEARAGRERRGAVVAIVAAPVAVLLTGLLLGFSPGGLVAFLRNSVELTLGFAAGMHDAHARTTLHLFAFAVPTALLARDAWQRWSGCHDDDRAEAAVGALLLAAFAFTRFKYGFTREGPGHLVPAVGALVLLVLLRLPAPPAGLVPRRPDARLASVLATLLVALLIVLEPAVPQPYRPAAAASDFVADLVEPVSSEDGPDPRVELLEDLELTPEVAPPPGSLHVDPWDIAAVWALDRVDDWAPPPVFQSYSAYTPRLDRLNAQHLAGPDAPDWVLRRPRMIDGRNPAWDPPRHLLSLACGYDLAAGGGAGWALLQRRDVPRCDALDAAPPEATVEVRLGEWFDRPRPDCGNALTVWNLRPDAAGLGDRLRTLAWVPPVWWVEAELDDGATVRWRWLPAFAGEPMLLDAPADARWALLGSSGRIERLRLLRADDVLQGPDRATVGAGCLG